MGYGNLPHHFLLYVFAAGHLPVLLHQENDWFGGALNSVAESRFLGSMMGSIPVKERLRVVSYGRPDLPCMPAIL
jgi:hypothetical protein